MKTSLVTLAPLESGRKSKAASLGSHPLLWGSIACVLFYLALPYAPFQQALLTRYCCSHPLEYITIGLFFFGMSTLIFRWRELHLETESVKTARSILQEVEQEQATGLDLANSILEKTRGLRDKISGSIAGQRLLEAANYFQKTNSSEHLESHLRHCADLELDRSQQRLGLVNTISWAIPIVGFLGTVMGITIAIANVSPEQLDQSLSEVTSGLGVAFDTTALSLSLSLVLVFATFRIRSRQEELLNEIEAEIDQSLTILFHSGSSNNIIDDQLVISQQLMEASERIVTEATAAWRETLNQLQGRLLLTLESEQQSFLSMIEQGFSSSLESQHNYLSAVRSRESERTNELLAHLETTLTDWNFTLSEVSGGLRSQIEEQRSQTILLHNMVEKQQTLTTLQQKLDESIDAHRITETLDQTLNSLTAAIQLLNARVNSSSRAA